MGTDDSTAIANELYRYAELLDAGRFAEVGQMLEHCSFRYGPERTPGPSGSQAIADSYRSMVITYSDGTPRTRHVTTNPIISIDGDTAGVRSAYTVLQQAGDVPLQPIVSGRYRDRLHRIDGRWRFVERHFLVDFVGDLSRHLRIDLPSDMNHSTIDEPSDMNHSTIDEPSDMNHSTIEEPSDIEPFDHRGEGSMSRWSREEIEEAFVHYQETALRAGTSGDWREWANLFTEDATYVEHHFGTMGGREAIYNWIQSTMSQWPNNEMIHFPIDWHLIDEERGWLVCQVWNRMADPGDGSLHQEYNFTLLKYAGNGMWSYEEDVYNPARFGEMVTAYLRHKKSLAAGSADEGGRGT